MLRPMLSDLQVIERIALAALLGGLVGLEREWRNKSAGLRTNILITLGSAIFTLLSIHLASGSPADQTRIAAQIVTGIGFIMRTGMDVHGLTTAATIWVNASIGMAVGGGAYRIAIIATAVTLVALVLLDPMERLIDRRRPPEKPPLVTSAGPAVEDAVAPSPAAPGGRPPSTPR
jgi:putative Mg2+ transporter-C (MgtC) family protein